ncbi:hypothetical protein ACOME3_002643 [Neoechinorhynchus agilis]
MTSNQQIKNLPTDGNPAPDGKEMHETSLKRKIDSIHEATEAKSPTISNEANSESLTEMKPKEDDSVKGKKRSCPEDDTVRILTKKSEQKTEPEKNLPTGENLAPQGKEMYETSPKRKIDSIHEATEAKRPTISNEANSESLTEMKPKEDDSVKGKKRSCPEDDTESIPTKKSEQKTEPEKNLPTDENPAPRGKEMHETRLKRKIYSIQESTEAKRPTISNEANSESLTEMKPKEDDSVKGRKRSCPEDDTESIPTKKSEQKTEPEKNPPTGENLAPQGKEMHETSLKRKIYSIQESTEAKRPTISNEANSESLTEMKPKEDDSVKGRKRSCPEDDTESIPTKKSEQKTEPEKNLPTGENLAPRGKEMHETRLKRKIYSIQEATEAKRPTISNEANSESLTEMKPKEDDSVKGRKRLCPEDDTDRIPTKKSEQKLEPEKNPPTGENLAPQGKEMHETSLKRNIDSIHEATEAKRPTISNEANSKSLTEMKPKEDDSVKGKKRLCPEDDTVRILTKKSEQKTEPEKNLPTGENLAPRGKEMHETSLKRKIDSIHEATEAKRPTISNEANSESLTEMKPKEDDSVKGKKRSCPEDDTESIPTKKSEQKTEPEKNLPTGENLAPRGKEMHETSLKRKIDSIHEATEAKRPTISNEANSESLTEMKPKEDDSVKGKKRSCPEDDTESIPTKKSEQKTEPENTTILEMLQELCFKLSFGLDYTHAVTNEDWVRLVLSEITAQDFTCFDILSSGLLPVFREMNLNEKNVNCKDMFKEALNKIGSVIRKSMNLAPAVSPTPQLTFDIKCSMPIIQGSYDRREFIVIDDKTPPEVIEVIDSSPETRETANSPKRSKSDGGENEQSISRTEGDKSSNEKAPECEPSKKRKRKEIRNKHSHLQNKRRREDPSTMK